VELCDNPEKLHVRRDLYYMGDPRSYRIGIGQVLVSLHPGEPASLVSGLMAADKDDWQIPAFAVFKLWTSIIKPYVLPYFFGSQSGTCQDEGAAAVSKRQQKMQKRQETGQVKIARR
jgi:hypothetical protein